MGGQRDMGFEAPALRVSVSKHCTSGCRCFLSFCFPLEEQGGIFECPWLMGEMVPGRVQCCAHPPHLLTT